MSLPHMSFNNEELPKKYPDVLIAIKHIEENYTRNISLKELSTVSHTSISALGRHFRSAFNMTPCQYIKIRRITNAAYLLKNGCSVTDAAIKSGYNDYSRFIAVFKQYYNVTPLKYQKNNTGDKYD